MDSNLYKQGFYSSSGTVLQRKISHKGDMYLDLFLRDFGRVWATAYGSAKGKVRFGGGTEPLTWGRYQLYRGTDRFSLKSVEVVDDMWPLRKNSNSLRISARMIRLVRHHLPPDQPDDKLLAILYWNTVLIARGCPPEIAEWRFMWRWLDSWGLAPSLRYCTACGAELDEALWDENGLFCPRCSIDRNGLRLKKRDLLFLLKMSISSFQELLENRLKEDPEISRLYSSVSGRLADILDLRT